MTQDAATTLTSAAAAKGPLVLERSTVKLAIDSHVNILMMECASKICVAETLRDKIGSTVEIAGVVKMGNDN